jgi:hypothetical protein
MALEMFKCSCGQEFEDSEFRISHECDECRSNVYSAALDRLMQQHDRAQRFYSSTLNNYVSNTFTIHSITNNTTEEPF